MKERGDFTADLRLLWISALAIPTGAVCALVALLLQRLIGFFTNVFYYGDFTFPLSLISPAGSVMNGPLGAWSILVPVAGGLIIGLMAYYGSEKIRGHGIPEAMEAILIGQSRMEPRVAVLKPLSSAVSIGSGGPFGAEGPIIMTGGAFGSIFAQVFHMTSAERKTLLVAGATGGMSATFGTPLAAVALAIELLLFELKPRSLVPVALASIMAALIRRLFSGAPLLSIGSDPLFKLDHLHSFLGPTGMACAALVGLLAGVLSLLLTLAVYKAEDAFHHVPIHWMWWPALGGLIVGLGGLIEPRALGVGYDIIDQAAKGKLLAGDALGLMIVKGLIWAIALGSGTSGGVLAPLLIMGGCLGALESTFLPAQDAGVWPLISMAAVMGGTMRSPLTGTLFALELTYDIRLLLPLLLASVIAHAFTVLVMKRSILTEKVARRGFHVSREYSVDPLEILSVGEVMTRDVVTIPASTPVRDLLSKFFGGSPRHQGFPVVDSAGNLLGVITRSNLLEHWIADLLQLGKGAERDGIHPIIAYDLLDRLPIVAHPLESCRTAAERMAAAGVGRLPVVEPEDPKKLVGLLTRSDLLKGRARYVEEEAKRERFIGGRVRPGQPSP